MNRYLSRTCTQVGSGQRCGSLCLLWSGHPFKWPFQADQAGPVPKGSRQCSHPTELQIIHSQDLSSSLGTASTLPSGVELACVHSMRNHTPGKTIMELRKEQEKGSSSDLLLSVCISASSSTKEDLFSDL